ncbi:MAG: hypothetical protein MSC30_03390 [Gaiellaceae bacterium MAG52_C11]|nr:hypothetical protein [Candidatus Gaiellasilicea maunaloa]
MLRSALFVLGLALRRLGRGTGATGLVVIGIALGAAAVVGVRAGTTVAQDRAVAQAVERIPEGSRSVRAVWFGVPGQSDDLQPALDARARSALRRAGALESHALVLFRETTIAGDFAGLGGVEGLARWVELRSGRLPGACRPERCEVLRLRGDGRLPAPPGLRLVEVGEAALASNVLFGDFLAPTDNALADAEVSPVVAAAAGYHRPAPPPLFLAEGVAMLAGAPALARLYRSYAWVAPLEAGTPRLWEIDDLAGGVTQARSELQARTTSFDLIAPVEELRSAQAESRRAGNRLALVGGEAAVLLFAFAILAAMTLRRDLRAARRRLAWSGARGWQLGLLTATETGLIALAGTMLGFALGLAGGALVAERAGAPVGDVLAKSILSGTGLLLVGLVAIAATAVLVATVASMPLRLGRAPVTPLDLAAIAAALLVVFSLRRGDDDSGLVLLLPGLVTFAAAVAIARLLRPVLRVAERLTHRGSHGGLRLGLRLAVLSLGRNPGYAVAATSFLVVSFGLALFAETYRATLSAGERDGAAYAVPRDFVVRQELRRLIPVLDAAPLGRLRALGPGVDVDPILRLTGGVGRQEGESGITLLGLPPSSVGLLRWRSDFGSRSPEALGAAIEAPDGDGSVRLGIDTRELVVRTSGDEVRFAAELRTVSGRFLRLDLGLTGTGTLRAVLPREARAGWLVGFAIEPATRLQERGADAGQAVSGRFRVLTPALEDWIGVGGARLENGAVSYTLTDQIATRLRPRVPSDREPVPVLATPRLAAAADSAGLLPLQIAGERVTVRVAERIARFPGVNGQAVVGDVGALLSLLNAERPGAARVDELWIGAADDTVAARLARELERKPYDVLRVVSRRALEAEARQDPIAHGTLLALAISALVALGLALAGILLTVLGDLRDERGELFDLEAEGAAPRLLRRVIRLRALTVTLAGLLAGALTGLALGAVVTDLVALTARATAAEPPLRLDVDWTIVGVALAVYTVAAGALVIAATRDAFPNDGAPGRVEAIE